MIGNLELLKKNSIYDIIYKKIGRDKMKKLKNLLLCFSLISVLFFTGCEEVPEKGIYKEGTYFGYAQSESYGTMLTTTAVVYVDDLGMIKSVFIDSTYIKTPGTLSTKKQLGDEYAMKTASANMGNIPGGAEWYEQVETLENEIVKQQGLNWIKWTDDTKTKTDSVAGVTIEIDDMYTAVNMALNNAK